MNPIFKLFCGAALLAGGTALLASGMPGKTTLSYPAGYGSDTAFYGSNVFYGKFHMPYEQAGLTERQAAAHLLSRFTYGARPGDVDRVVHMGLEKWFRAQLEGKEADDSLNQLMAGYDAMKLSNAEIARSYPRAGEVLRMAVRDGLVDKDSVKTDRKEYRGVLKNYMDQKGYKPEQELFRQFYAQKILRAAYTNNQLREMLTDFWFNHFNVSIVKNDCAQFIPDYERDVIRPGALGKFNDLLLATAKSPAMLYYLDNFSSSGPMQQGRPGRPYAGMRRQQAVQGEMSMRDSSMVAKVQKVRKAQGLNENYAREVMELHTLGVDGGYTQQDVTQAARVLTGWTVYPMGQYGMAMEARMDKAGPDGMARLGIVREGDFLFNANRHDKGEKRVLGKSFPAGGGYEEGVQLLDMLAHHTSTAHFICKKIAVRFVNDNPPQSLIDRMAETFLHKDGDIKEVMLTMVSSPEFWSRSSLREKTKSPFELAIGAVRSLDAHIYAPFQLYNWVAKMGEKMYFYQAPTGFPDKGQYWINTGALLNRMNFGLALASGRIPGVTVDLAALNNHHEPESAEAALAIYCKLIMPERDPGETIRRLTPMLSAPDLAKKVDDASNKVNAGAGNGDGENGQMNTATASSGTGTMTGPAAVMADDNGGDGIAGKAGKGGGKGRNNRDVALQTTAGNNSMLSQVVGIIIGSPEYQRR